MAIAVVPLRIRQKYKKKILHFLASLSRNDQGAQQQTTSYDESFYLSAKIKKSLFEAGVRAYMLYT